jgi:hypothetical protein
MDSTPHHLMYHLLAPGYDQVQWNTPYLDNTKAAIDSTNPVIALNSANTTTTVDGPIVQPPSSIYCPLPVKYEQPLQSVCIVFNKYKKNSTKNLNIQKFISEIPGFASFHPIQSSQYNFALSHL